GNGSRQRHSSPSSLASGSSTDETGPPHRIPDSPGASADMAVPREWRAFFYMPFEHSENLTDQTMSVKLFTELGDASYLDYAIRHRDVIERFGRFPHRNGILARMSSAAEEEYLAQPGAGF
ncbi:DUF924 family protein, partial [Sinorhizobium meliloti]|uniref:DUF924 family protein n=1 Tax=Rhizobium meliloti TaxID=382 RepID=UPI001F1DE55C